MCVCVWLFKQLAFWISCMVESAVLQETSPEPGAQEAFEPEVVEPDVVLVGANEGKRLARAKRHSLKLKIKELLPTDKKRMLLQYYFASRRHFGSERGVLHLAFDASRVGGLNRMVGYITNVAGFGAWTPPRALSSTRHTTEFLGAVWGRPKTGLHNGVFPKRGLHNGISRDIPLHRNF